MMEDEKKVQQYSIIPVQKHILILLIILIPLILSKLER